MNDSGNPPHFAPISDQQEGGSQLSCWLRHLEAQLEVSLEESEKPYDQLADLFSSLMRDGLPGLDGSGTKGQQWLQEKINKTVIAFQFYDRMHQRLIHVRDGLNMAVSSINNASDLNKSSALELIEKSAALYSSRQQSLITEFSRNQEMTISEIEASFKEMNTSANLDVELF